ncbi:MAG: DUF3418 domain-containing protein, partial [Burkholderiaceae bacterium]|nr:DUF3418 domain-containing protein [Burkholderiaceae bacterium]
TVYSRSGLQAWLEEDRANLEQKDQSLRLQKSDLMRHEAAGISADRYPKTIVMNGVSLQTSYHFEPGSPKDGITLIVPITVLNQVDAIQAEWLVPGLCVEKVQLLLKSLPQKIRRHCIPLPESAKQFVQERLDSNSFGKGDLTDCLMRFVRNQNPIEIKRSDFRPEALPAHCHMNFRLIDEHGRQLELERNLNRLRSEYGGMAREAFQSLADANIKTVQTDQAQASPIQKGSYQAWDFGELPQTVTMTRGNQTIQGYPALVDRKTAVELEVFDDPAEAKRVHRQGLCRLYSVVLKEHTKALHRIDKLRSNASRDAQNQRDWESVARPWQRMVQESKGMLGMNDEHNTRLREFRWQLEELRVALFAQELKTPMPMSVKRLEKVLASLR